jgi:hypothetical protein
VSTVTKGLSLVKTRFDPAARGVGLCSLCTGLSVQAGQLYSPIVPAFKLKR